MRRSEPPPSRFSYVKNNDGLYGRGYASDRRRRCQSPDEKPAPMKIKVGDMAPEFSLLVFDGKELKKVSLQDFRGNKNVALAFYVFAFTGG